MSRPSRIGTPELMQRRQRAAEARHRDLAQDVAEDRQLQHDRVDRRGGRSSVRVVALEARSRRAPTPTTMNGQKRDQVVAERDDDARRQRQLGAEAGEQRAKVGMTFHRMTPTTTPAMTMTAIG